MVKPCWRREGYGGGDVPRRHDEPIAISVIGPTMSLQRNIVAVGILDGDARHSARRRIQREGLARARSPYVVLIRSPSPNSTRSYDFDGDGIRILDGIAIQVVAREAVEVFGQFAVSERVVFIAQLTILITYVLVVLLVLTRNRAIESDVIDNTFGIFQTTSIKTRDATHVGIVVFHVTGHNTVFDGTGAKCTFVCADDAAHLGRI